MVEVFITNVTCQEKAEELVAIIESHFQTYEANFDLDDCDNIMRVMSVNTINTKSLINFLECYGVKIEPLN